MSFYNFSSTDPKHYNRMRVMLPPHFLAHYVQLCVSTFTCNCNIEVMNEDDYIEFLIDNQKHKVFMKQYCKIDTASLPHILQDILNAANVPLTVSITNIDTLQLTGEDYFEILDMTYNMRLITGCYCTKPHEWPIKAQSFHTQTSIAEPVNKDLVDIQYNPMNMRINDYLPLDKILTPADAYGYTIQYQSGDTNIAQIDENGYVIGATTGETYIIAEIRNPNSSPFVQADFIREIPVKVAIAQEVFVENVSLPDELTIIETNDYTLYPKITPFYASYSEIWVSSDPAIATVNNGYIRAIKPGTATIHYQLKTPTQQLINKDVKVKIKSQYVDVIQYRTISNSVGYMLSTPIFYLLTNIGNNIYFNEIYDQKKLQAATVCMCLNNTYTASFPIVAQQADIITKCAINATSDIHFILVDANMHEIKLLNPMYITVKIEPDADDPAITPGLLR